ncbi:MAG: Clp protease N-terminal domain-containing protein [Pseudomonadota bacterium]
MAQQALASAQADAARRGNPEVTGLHVLHALLDEKGGSARAILTKAGVNADQIASIAASELDRLPTTSSGAGSGGQQLMTLVAEADKTSRAMGDAYITGEHLLIALAKTKGPAFDVLDINAATPDVLSKAVADIRAASGVEHVNDQNAEASFEALKKYGIDLTERAQQGKLDPVIGRDDEIRRTMQVLSRRTKNNPVLIGEPGVGKTAIAEGLALRS